MWATSAVVGPAIGGFFATYADWRWIFLVNLPVGAIALLLVGRHLREPRRPEPRRHRIDWPGAVGLFVSGGLLLTALVQGGVAWGWLSTPSLLLFGGALVGSLATVRIEQRAAEPIIPGWVWRRRMIVSVNLALGALGLLMIAPTVFLPTYAQTVLGLEPDSRRLRAVGDDAELAGERRTQQPGLPAARVPRHRGDRHGRRDRGPDRLHPAALPRAGLAAGAGHAGCWAPPSDSSNCR